MGFAITPVCNNLYLADLDRAMEHAPGMLYCRYGDDIVLGHSDRAALLEAADLMTRMVQSRGLSFKAEKLREWQLCAPPAPKPPAGFAAVPSLDYVGFNVDAAGSIFLSRRKLRELQRTLRRTARTAAATAVRLRAAENERVAAAVNSLNLYFCPGLQPPQFGEMLKTITNLDALKALDKWIAKAVLRYVYGSGHDRVFKHHSYRRLRRGGLCSLVQLRNAAMRRRESLEA